MEFQKGPLPVSQAYTDHVREILKGSRVTYTGAFSEAGTFDVVKLGENTEMDNCQRMFASNLLRFTPFQDGLRTNREGFLFVYGGRMQMRRGEKPTPIFTIDPANARLVDEYRSFPTTVGESGWLFGGEAAFIQRIRREVTHEQLEEILAQAETGKRPPFFDESTLYVKVKPENAGKNVYIVKMWEGEEAVVVDTQERKLLERYTERLLSVRRWGVEEKVGGQVPEPMQSTSNSELSG